MGRSAMRLARQPTWARATNTPASRPGANRRRYALRWHSLTCRKARRHGDGQAGDAPSGHRAPGQDQFACRLSSYQVSGECDAHGGGTQNGWLDERAVVMGIAALHQRAPALTGILSYFIAKTCGAVAQSTEQPPVSKDPNPSPDAEHHCACPAPSPPSDGAPRPAGSVRVADPGRTAGRRFAGIALIGAAVGPAAKAQPVVVVVGSFWRSRRCRCTAHHGLPPVAALRNLIGGHMGVGLVGVACYRYLPDVSVCRRRR